MTNLLHIPKYTIAKKSYTFYADDTHSGGRVIDKKFQPVPTGQDGLRPILNSSGILIKSENEDRFFTGFNTIRSRYAAFLGLSDLPVIHMRQIWGKHPPEDKGRNPFSEVDFDTRFKWTREIIEYICDVKNNGAEGFLGGDINIDDLNKTSVPFYNSDIMIREYEYLLEKFGSKVKHFYDIILNPLPLSIGMLMHSVDAVVGNRKGVATFVYDYSEGSKGFDTLQSYEIAREVGTLQNISSVVAGNTRTHPGLQCADVVAYISQRQKYAKYVGRRDIGVEMAMKGLQFPVILSKEDNEVVKPDLQRNITTMLHYELGIRYLRTIDPDWVECNMYQPAELLLRLREKRRFGGLLSGSNLILDKIHEQLELSK